jgi:hypothetical protein
VLILAPAPLNVDDCGWPDIGRVQLLRQCADQHEYREGDHAHPGQCIGDLKATARQPAPDRTD